ncbi:hypothetical protein EYC80_005212 [Monilinia laxa]|uniref:Uncharacterized protein n=1 Tax=Monilinia laxa TaxID=61186 RepID=A0A5N6KJS9_MONLA|nr:hypothetical protein EYC80_005212 [Monilinia laxa]
MDTGMEDIGGDIGGAKVSETSNGGFGRGENVGLDKEELEGEAWREGLRCMPAFKAFALPESDNSTRTSSDYNTSFLNSKSSDQQRNEGKEENNGEVGEKSSGSIIQPQNKDPKRIDASRQVIMALQASLRANGLLPVFLSQEIIHDSLPRTLLNPSTAMFKPEPTISQQEERVPELDGESLVSEVHLQKKPRRRAPKLLDSERKRLKTEQEITCPSIQKDVQDTSAQYILSPVRALSMPIHSTEIKEKWGRGRMWR